MNNNEEKVRRGPDALFIICPVLNGFLPKGDYAFRFLLIITSIIVNTITTNAASANA